MTQYDRKIKCGEWMKLNMPYILVVTYGRINCCRIGPDYALTMLRENEYKIRLTQAISASRFWKISIFWFGSRCSAFFSRSCRLCSRYHQPYSEGVALTTLQIQE
ncbi:hypothetical protein M514_04095 [Trichuris suis]|uniref:Uncharacterized protein n=1 Tax=Trichuris suis TaxID=68888 RepID=A0A085NFZ6_9BILA|nr:hypothetical protein M513_04095 [Trichuris suis]KFD68392.1 hypothetical protein M514_04095 [Trichuris suis]